jgi:acetyl esterase/lipase
MRFARETLGGVPAERCARPSGDGDARVILYLHGGGYVAGSLDSHRDVVARLALAASATAVTVAYRLAPENPFPAAQEDALAAARALLGAVSPSRVVIAGDSAGGALCIATLLALRDAREALPAGALLLSPWVDPLAAGGSMDANEPFDVGDRAFLLRCIEAFLGGAPAAHPWVTPLRAELAGLPPLRIVVGRCELLLDQVRAFGARAAEAGVDVRISEFEDMFHGFQTFARWVPAAARAIDGLGAAARELVPGGEA